MEDEHGVEMKAATVVDRGSVGEVETQFLDLHLLLRVLNWHTKSFTAKHFRIRGCVLLDFLTLSCLIED